MQNKVTQYLFAGIKIKFIANYIYLKSVYFKSWNDEWYSPQYKTDHTPGSILEAREEEETKKFGISSRKLLQFFLSRQGPTVGNENSVQCLSD